MNYMNLYNGYYDYNEAEYLIESHTFSFKKTHLTYHLQNGDHHVSASMCKLF